MVQYHDPANNITASSAGDIITESLYTAAGRLTKTLDPNGSATTYDYDGLGRQITVTDAASNKQIVLYDNADRALTQKRLDYDGTNHITFTTAMAYDGRNQITMVVDTNNSLTQKTFYDALGQVTQTQDPAGMKVATTYDFIGRVTRTTEDVDGIARYTDSLYDRAGRLTRLVGYTADATGAQNTDYAYNKAGVLTRSTYPDDAGGDRGYVEYVYDTPLRLTKVTDQEAQDTVIVYDSMSRRTAITKGTEVDTFAYNTAGQVTLARRGTSANADATSQSERLYDGLLRLTREAQSVRETAARNVDYAYDDASNVLTLTHPNGAAIQTSYTAIHQPNVIKRSGSQLADYDYVGYRPKSLTYETGANDVVLSNRYDGGARLTRMTYAQSGNATLPDFSYSFDAASNITRKKFEHRSGAPSEDYLYDTLDRLTRTDFGQRTSTPYESFVYDDLGNHLTQNDNGTTVAGLFNTANEQTKRAGTDMLYDKKGNLTKDDDGQVYFYDRQNLLTRVEKPASTLIASYSYDAFNRRIEKDVNGGDVTRFYWTTDWRLLEETDNAGTPNVQRYYVWGNYIDELLLFRDVVGVGGTANADYFACRHHNYNIVALLNTSGGVVERYDYNPYGQRFVLNTDYTGDADGVSDFGLTIGHQGLMHDEESGLVYNRHRMLHTQTGRFMQRDPLDQNEPGGGYQDGMNLYTFTRSHPIAYLDPTGKQAKSVQLLIYINPNGMHPKSKPRAVMNKLRTLMAPCFSTVTPPDIIVVHTSPPLFADPPTQLGWVTDEDCFSKYQGQISTWNASKLRPYAQTGKYKTVIYKAAFDNDDGGSPIDGYKKWTDDEWTTLFANVLAHEQIHLGAFKSYDYGPAPEINSGSLDAHHTRPIRLLTVPAAWCAAFKDYVGVQ